MIEHYQTKIQVLFVDIAIKSTNDHPIGVVYLVHGHTGHKEDYTIRRFQHLFADMGFEAVALDASRHGEDKRYPYTNPQLFIEQQLAMPDVIWETLQAIAKVHQTHYQDKYAFFGVLGISMGGHVAYLLPKLLPTISFIIPLIGAPDIWMHYNTTKREIIHEDVDRLKQAIEPLSLPDLSVYQTIDILQINGTKDEVVNYENSFLFHNSLPKADHREHWFVLEEVGHTVTEAFVRVFEEFMQKILKRRGNENE